MLPVTLQESGLITLSCKTMQFPPNCNWKLHQLSSVLSEFELIHYAVKIPASLITFHFEDSGCINTTTQELGAAKK
jgi:hypothetical protein